MTTITEVYQSVEGLLGPDKDTLIRDALNWKLGHNTWSLLEVADRGNFIVYQDSNEEIFVFDGVPLLKFQRLITEGNHINIRVHYQFEVLYGDQL